MTGYLYCFYLSDKTQKTFFMKEPIDIKQIANDRWFTITGEDKTEHFNIAHIIKIIEVKKEEI